MVEFGRNKKAYHDYELIEEFEAGIALLGPEVKSLRRGRVQLKGSYVAILTDGPYAMGIHITAYPFAHKPLDPLRKRKLLLNQKEIDKLQRAEQTSGLTIVPLAFYDRNGLIKLKIAIGKGRKLHDKREKMKQNTIIRQTERIVKQYR